MTRPKSHGNLSAFTRRQCGDKGRLKGVLRPRVIARLDIKAPNLVKGIHLEGLRVIGNPATYAERYYEQGADELLYMDIVASLYGRSTILSIIRAAAARLFVPLTVGGGIRTIEDVREVLRQGADKVAINTAAVRRPELLTEAARIFGSQAIVVSIEAQRTEHGWEAFTDNGREHTGLDAIAWAQEAVAMGAGEVLITSIDQEGTRRGFDLPLLRAVRERVGVPVIASGGAGSVDHVVEAFVAGADAVAVASMLHYGDTTIGDLKTDLARKNIPVRSSLSAVTA